MDIATIISAFIAMIAAGWNLLRNLKQNKNVTLSFKIEEKILCLSEISIMRKHVSRSEIMGLLGVYQKDSKERFKIAYLSKRAFFENLYAVQDGKSDELIIELTPKELEQFEIVG